MPNMVATRSQCAMATNPQFRPPTTKSTAAITSNVFIVVLLFALVLFAGKQHGIDHMDDTVGSSHIGLQHLGVVHHDGISMDADLHILSVDGFRRRYLH